MARKKSDDRVKRALLLGFVIISVALIASIYVTGLTGSEEPAPAFYRGAAAMEPSIESTIVAPRRENSGPGQATATAPHLDFEPPSSRYD